MIDLKTLTENSIAVRCKTEDEAKEFVSRVFKLLPDACRYWQEGVCQWKYYKENTCYSILGDRDPNNEPTLYYSSDYDYEHDGYQIVNFDEVVFTTQDLGALDLSVADLSYLFGLEVATND